MNLIAVGFFVPTVLATLLITAWAAKRAHSRADYYSAGGRITGAQNGLAVAGDLISASTFLGLTGMFFVSGADMSAIYYVTPPVALCLLLVLLAAPLRRAGRYTLGDVVVSRARGAPLAPALRILTGASTIVISLLFLVAQLVGAGSLISLLFGIQFPAAVALITVLMTIYVGFGGMLAATWVQIIKAGMLVGVVIVLAVACVVKAGSLTAIYEQAAAVHPLGWGLFRPGAEKADLFSAVSLGISTTVGALGLPHLLIRFFTVPGEREAQQSAAIATTIMAFVILLLFMVISPAAVAFLSQSGFTDAAGGMRGGLNMTAVNLSQAVGGSVLMGVTCAIAFATIIAVVAGVVMAIASAASHDIYAVIRTQAPHSERAELWAFRIATILSGVVGLALSFVFQHENVSFMIALAMTVAISANVPVLLLTLYWKRLTAQGAFAGICTGLVGSVGLLILGPSIWVKVLGHAAPIFPSDYPGLLVAPLALAAAVLISLTGSPRPAVSLPAGAAE